MLRDMVMAQQCFLIAVTQIVEDVALKRGQDVMFVFMNLLNDQAMQLNHLPNVKFVDSTNDKYIKLQIWADHGHVLDWRNLWTGSG